MFSFPRTVCAILLACLLIGCNRRDDPEPPLPAAELNSPKTAAQAEKKQAEPSPILVGDPMVELKAENARLRRELEALKKAADARMHEPQTAEDTLMPGTMKVGDIGKFPRQDKDFFFRVNHIHNDTWMSVRCIAKGDARSHGSLFQLLGVSATGRAIDSVIELDKMYRVDRTIKMMGGTAGRGEVGGGSYLVVMEVDAPPVPQAKTGKKKADLQK